MDITHDNVCSSMLSCFYSHLLSTGRPISSSCYVFIIQVNLHYMSDIGVFFLLKCFSSGVFVIICSIWCDPE